MIAPEFIDIAKLPSLSLTDRKRLPSVAACYLVLQKETVIYIGRTKNILNRWRGHQLLSKIKSLPDIRIAWVQVSDVSILPGVEAALIAYFTPQFNVEGEGKFQQKFDEPLAATPISLRLPIPIDRKIRQLPKSQRTAWLRRVIVAAAERELSD